MTDAEIKPQDEKAARVVFETPFDAGLLNDYGDGNVEWWHDYIRALLHSANEHYRQHEKYYQQAIANAREEGIEQGREEAGQACRRIRRVVRKPDGIKSVLREFDLTYNTALTDAEVAIRALANELAQPDLPDEDDVENLRGKLCHAKIEDRHRKAADEIVKLVDEKCFSDSRSLAAHKVAEMFADAEAVGRGELVRLRLTLDAVALGVAVELASLPDTEEFSMPKSPSELGKWIGKHIVAARKREYDRGRHDEKMRGTGTPRQREDEMPIELSQEEKAMNYETFMREAQMVGILVGRECANWHWQLHCLRHDGSVAVHVNYYPTKQTMWIDSHDERWKSYSCGGEWGSVVTTASVIQSTLNGDPLPEAQSPAPVREVAPDAPRDVGVDRGTGKDESRVSDLRPPVSIVAVEKAVSVIVAAMSSRLDEKGPGAWQSSHELLGVITEEFHELQHAVERNNHEDVAAECVDIAVAAIFALACAEAGELQW